MPDEQLTALRLENARLISLPEFHGIEWRSVRPSIAGYQDKLALLVEGNPATWPKGRTWPRHTF